MVPCSPSDRDGVCRQLEYDITETHDSDEKLDEISHLTSTMASGACDSMDYLALFMEDVVKLKKTVSNSLVCHERYLTTKYRELQQRNKHLTSTMASGACDSMDYLALFIEDVVKLKKTVSNSLVCHERYLTTKYRELQQRNKTIGDLELKISVDKTSRENEVNELNMQIQKHSDMLHKAEEQLRCLKKQKTEKKDEAEQVRAVVNFAGRLSQLGIRETSEFMKFLQQFGELMKSKWRVVECDVDEMKWLCVLKQPVQNRCDEQ